MISIREVLAIRHKVQYLDLTIAAAAQLYAKMRYRFIRANEVAENGHGMRDGKFCAYLDSKGNKTVGIGFNMDAKRAGEQWYRTFIESISFDAVYNGARCLTEEEAEQLYSACIATRLIELKNIYASGWNRLAPNIQLAIEDAYYNGGSALVGGRTNFYQQIRLYSQSHGASHLEKAGWEIKENSNPAGHKGIQNRRYVQYMMLLGRGI